MVKPVIGGEATSECIRRAARGNWGGACRKMDAGTWEIRRGALGCVEGQRRWGIHNLPRGRGRKSERPIVATEAE